MATAQAMLTGWADNDHVIGCVGAKNTIHIAFERHTSWDVLQCSKPVAKCTVHQSVKVTCMIIHHKKCVANRCVHIVVIGVPAVGCIQGSRVGCWDDSCVVNFLQLRA